MLDDSIPVQLDLFGNDEPLRRHNDFYGTPYKCVEAIYPVLYPLFRETSCHGFFNDGSHNWLEPCAGDGAIIRHVDKVINSYNTTLAVPQWHAFELRKTEYHGLLAHT